MGALEALIQSLVGGSSLARETPPNVEREKTAPIVEGETPPIVEGETPPVVEGETPPGEETAEWQQCERHPLCIRGGPRHRGKVHAPPRIPS